MARDPFGALGQAMSYSGALSRNLALGQQAKQRRQRMVAEGSLSPLESAQSDYSGEWDPFFEALQQKEEETNAAGGNFRVNWSGFGKPSEDYMPRRGDSRVYGALGDYGDERGGGLSFFDRESLKNQALTEASMNAAMEARARDAAQEDYNRQREQQFINDATTSYQQDQLAQAFAPPMQSTVTTETVGPTGRAEGYTMRPARPEGDRERIWASLPPALKPKMQEKWAAEDAAAQKQALEEAKFIESTKPKDSGRLVQVMGPKGSPIWVKEADAVGQPAAQAPRAVTGAERTALSFYNRAKEAADTVGPLEESIGKMGLGSQARLEYAPNWLQSPENQSYRQAQRAFTEARLRKESGAAIPTAEYTNDSQTYFAQPGDTPEILEQKRKARNTVLKGLAFSAGKAYDEYYGEPREPAGGSGGGGGPVAMVAPDGRELMVPADKVSELEAHGAKRR